MTRNHIKELFNAAMNLVDARHTIVQYSPPQDAVVMYDVIMFNSYMAISESLMTLCVKATGVDLIDVILRHLVKAGHLALIMKHINQLLHIHVTNLESRRLFDYALDILSDSAKNVLKSSHNIRIPDFGKVSNLSTVTRIKEQIINRLPYFSIGGTIVAYGWLYLNVLKDYIKSKKTLIPAEELIHKIYDFYKNNDKEFQNITYITTNHIIQSFNEPIGNSEEEITERLVDEVKFGAFIDMLECEEIRHVMSLYISADSFLLGVMNYEASWMIMTVNRGKQVLDVFNTFNQKNVISECCKAHIDMINKFVNLERYPKVSIKSIPLYYAKLATNEIELPDWLTFDYTSLEYFILKSNIQCIECLIQAIQIIVLRRSAYSQYTISEITVLWTVMMTDILCLVYNDEALKSKINEYTPILISFIISCFSSESDMYSESQINKIKQYCQSQYPADKLNDILTYAPDYFGIIRKNGKYNVDDSRKLVNYTQTEYLSNVIIQAAQNNYSAEALIKELSLFKIEKEVSNILYKIYRLL